MLINLILCTFPYCKFYKHNYRNDDIKGTAALILTVQFDIYMEDYLRGMEEPFIFIC